MRQDVRDFCRKNYGQPIVSTYPCFECEQVFKTQDEAGAHLMRVHFKRIDKGETNTMRTETTLDERIRVESLKYRGKFLCARFTASSESISRRYGW